MARPPRARERVLDAFQELLICEGERAATLEATAATAGVSKGGLLYHFTSKEELIAGMLERLEQLLREDIDALLSAPDGPVSAYLRTSAVSDSALDQALVAAARLAQSGSEAATKALHDGRRAWADLLRPYVKDDLALELILIFSDGLYFNNALNANGVESPLPTGEELEALIARVVRETTV